MEAPEAVARVIASAETAPTTEEIIGALEGTYSEEEVLDALEYLRREIDAEEGVDGRWTWLGPPAPK